MLFGGWRQRTHNGIAEHDTGAVHHSAYQDDTYRVGPIHAIASSWHKWKSTIETSGGEVNMRKSVLWIPGGGDVIKTVIDAMIPDYNLPIVTDGLDVLGGVAQHRHATALGKFSRKLATVAKRLKEATEYSDRI